MSNYFTVNFFYFKTRGGCLLKLDLKLKLILLTGIPIFIIFILSVGRVVYEVNAQKDLKKVQIQLVEINTVANIIHFIQRERGLSIESNESDYRELLDEVRKNLDSTLQNVKKKDSSNKELYTQLLKDIYNIRKSMDNQEEPLDNIKYAYTKHIHSLLDFIETVPVEISDREIRNYIEAYEHLALSKEKMGQIRSILFNAFASNNITKKDIAEVQNAFSIYKEYKEQVKYTLVEDLKLFNLYNNSVENDDIKRTQDIIQRYLDGIARVKVTPLEWFLSASKSIDTLRQLEEIVFSDANAVINSKIEQSKKRFYIILFGLLSLIIVVTFIMINTVKKVLKSTYLLNEEFENSLVLLEQYKQTVDGSFIVSKTDARGVIKYVNDAFCKISGYSRDELIGKPHNIIRHPDMPKEVFKEMWHTIKELKEPWIGDIKNLKKDGSSYWMRAFINPILDKEGKIVEYIGMRTDITELQNEKDRIRNSLGITTLDFEEARQRAREYEKAIDATWSVIRTDTNNVITYINKTFEDLSGYKREEVIGTNCSELRSKKHIDNRDCENVKIKLANNEVVHMEFENIGKDKNICYMDTTIIPISNKDGVIVEHLHLMCNITEIMLLHKEIESTQQEVIYRMGEIGESRSKETGNHVRRVSEYAKLLALKLGFNEDEAELIADASPMHDIGKVAIPDEVLLKPGSLDANEWEIMKTHSYLGYKVLSGSKRKLLNAAAVIAHEHHEKYDGSGYPNGKKAEQIHLYARIVAIADVFDALGSDRAYKKGWELDKILNLFKEQKGKHFDPNLVDLFLDNLDEFLVIRDKYVDKKI